MIEIEKGVPIPKDGRGRRGTLTDILEQMSVGDSILVPDKTQTSVSAAARNFGRPREQVFTTRKTNKGIRLWRTA